MPIELEQDDTVWGGQTEHASLALDAWLGRRVGSHYRVIGHLGSGGMAHVFLTEHTLLGSRAALKVLSAQSSEPIVQRFIEEARILARLNHPNIVRLLDLGTCDSGLPYILMEYAPGTNLEQWLAGGARCSQALSLLILQQVARALDHIHTGGVLHRDIKPSNIMLDPAALHAVKLVDFGIATVEASAESASDQLLSGTPAYMSPEQAAGQLCTRASDTYSLAALALEMLTGQPPYARATTGRTLTAVLHERPATPSTRGLLVPGLDAFFQRALARDPASRFQHAGALVDELAQVLAASQRIVRPRHVTAASALRRMTRGALGLSVV